MSSFACYWRNVPAALWRYKIGGCQVVEKWLSYREHAVLGRALRADEVAYLQEMTRRIAAILLMGPRPQCELRRLQGRSLPVVESLSIDWLGCIGQPR